MSNKDSVNLAVAVKELADNILAHLELQELQAKITRRKFLSLMNEGFTESQALQLCKIS